MTAESALAARQHRKNRMRGTMLGIGIAGAVVLLVIAATALSIAGQPTFSGRGSFVSVNFRASKDWTWTWEASGIRKGDAADIFLCALFKDGKELGGAMNRSYYSSKPLPAGVYSFIVDDEKGYRPWSIKVHGLVEMDVPQKSPK